VHSALLTSACRAAFAIIAKNFTSTQEAMRLLNECVYETVQGSMNMTCVIAALDITTGHLTYTNASHEAPVIMPNKNGTLKKADFVFLPEIHGPRLGQQSPCSYKYSEVQLLPNQHLLFYSDGLLDVVNREGEKLGERKLLKYLGENYQGSLAVDNEKHKLLNQIGDYRSNQFLEDDLSFFFMKWNPNV
jgi:sigma-B regulation protein RsbU (phosphoserine phosphatase)